MLSENYIKKCFVFDIETTSQYCDFETCQKENPSQAEAFEFYYSIRNNEPDVTIFDYYKKKAKILPEYSKIICISYGSIKSIKEQQFTIKTICSNDEKEVLVRFKKLLMKIIESGYNLAGHNIKGFDIPFLVRRYLINGIKVPENLWIGNKKPWELPFVDTKDLWQSGAWDLKSSLYEIAISMGLNNCKDDMDGNDVFDIHCNDENWIEIITKYCEGDVRTTMELLTRFCNEFYEIENEEEI